jgi:hypothetical protein
MFWYDITHAIPIRTCEQGHQWRRQWPDSLENGRYCPPIIECPLCTERNTSTMGFAAGQKYYHSDMLLVADIVEKELDKSAKRVTITSVKGNHEKETNARTGYHRNISR